MKVVIDTNVIISAALGSQTCKEAILKTLEKYEVIEPKIVSMELDCFYLKMSQEIKNTKKVKAIYDYFRIFLMFIKIGNPKKVLDVSPDKPDNYFISLALEYSAIFITGDKSALKYARDMKIDAKLAVEFLE
ncbi:MAG TPA: putative toxin-antitoxin system toxin component, PIN family [Candidatus Atribacteria bacterium]|nr:putative toxin-antitoxin system toxin component, PIN family [Candidatus Atribacteria bacterium]